MTRCILAVLLGATILTIIPAVLAPHDAHAQSIKGNYCHNGHWNPRCK
jgi:hypothetical protein